MYKKLLKPVFFLFSPEAIHHFVFAALRFVFLLPGSRSIAKKKFCIEDDRLRRQVLGLDFPNPVGLAAGFDKDALLVEELSCLGYGFIEIGTVTPLPQAGNLEPRMFRLPKDEALINRMGFNNRGIAAAAARLKRIKPGIIVGVNIGKNKSTPNKLAVHDYEKCFKELFDVADYFVVNVSSPNTPGLRELQEKEPLKKILLRLKELNAELSRLRSVQPEDGVSRANRGRLVPLLLKIAPDLSDRQLDDVVEIIAEAGIDGVVATNTTISRDKLQTGKAALDAIGAGGLSGKPLRNRSTEVIRYLHHKSQGKFVIIGVGGINSPEDAIEKLKAGASLVQLYTGFIYEGPGLAKRINNSLLSFVTN